MQVLRVDNFAQRMSARMKSPKQNREVWAKLLTSLVRSSTLMAAFWPKEALTRVFKETDGSVSRHDSARASKRQSQQGTYLVKVEPRAPRHERRRVAVADVAEKIRFHMPFREELLLAGLTFARCKELLIEFCVIKA
jgi:hypothetical protein